MNCIMELSWSKNVRVKQMWHRTDGVLTLFTILTFMERSAKPWSRESYFKNFYKYANTWILYLHFFILKNSRFNIIYQLRVNFLNVFSKIWLDVILNLNLQLKKKKNPLDFHELLILTLQITLLDQGLDLLPQHVYTAYNTSHYTIFLSTL